LRSKRSRESEAREFFTSSADEVHAALREARGCLEELVPKQHETERLAREASDCILLKSGHRDWERYRCVLELRATEDNTRIRRELLENESKLVIGQADGLDKLATCKSHTVKKLDESAFKLAEPKLFETFVHTLMQRAFRLQ